ADRQPRPPHRRRGDGAARSAAPCRHHADRRHPRPRARRPSASPHRDARRRDRRRRDMNLRDTMTLSFATVASYRTRSLLIVLAMALGVAAVVVLTALGDGARRYVV